MRIQHNLRRWRHPRKQFADGTFEAEYFSHTTAAAKLPRRGSLPLSSVKAAEIFAKTTNERKKKVFLMFKF